MRIIETKDYEAMSELCVSIIVSTLLVDRAVNLSLTSGNTPHRTYEKLIDICSRNKQLVKQATFFNFDECFVGKQALTKDTMYQSLYQPLAVDTDKIYSITEANYLEYDTMIETLGGLDLMVIGLGGDGHFCGNMPMSTDFNKGCHRILVEDKYPWYSYLSTYFSGTLPKYIYTMGTKSIMKVKHLVLIVNGKQKAAALKQLLEGNISNEFPASILKLHPNLTIIVDEEASK